MILASTPVDRETAVPVAVTYSPTLPAVALLPLVTPTIFGVVIVGEEREVMFELAPDVAIAELQPNPVPFVH